MRKLLLRNLVDNAHYAKKKGKICRISTKKTDTKQIFISNVLSYDVWAAIAQSV